jgi:S1-C subfamily serine protease
VNDKTVRRLSDLTDELERNGIGKTVRLTVLRGGRTRTVETEVVAIGRTL